MRDHGPRMCPPIRLTCAPARLIELVAASNQAGTSLVAVQSAHTRSGPGLGGCA